MVELVQALTTDDLKEGEMKSVTVNGQEVLIARAGGRFYAANNICPHMGGKLANGSLNGTIVTCPRHASQFDLTDGRVVRWTGWSGIKLSLAKLFKPPRPIKTFPVKIEGQSVMVKL